MCGGLKPGAHRDLHVNLHVHVFVGPRKAPLLCAARAPTPSSSWPGAEGQADKDQTRQARAWPPLRRTPAPEAEEEGHVSGGLQPPTPLPRSEASPPPPPPAAGGRPGGASLHGVGVGEGRGEASSSSPSFGVPPAPSGRRAAGSAGAGWRRWGSRCWAPARSRGTPTPGSWGRCVPSPSSSSSAPAAPAALELLLHAPG